MTELPFSREEIDELILMFADEEFGLKDAIRFETLVQTHPNFYKVADINRTVRNKLQALPKIKAKPGFEARLAHRIDSTHTNGRTS